MPFLYAPDRSAVEEFRENVTELLGEPNEAIVDSLLNFASREIARVAAGAMTACWRAEDDHKAFVARVEKALDDAEWGGPDRGDAVADIREAVFGVKATDKASGSRIGLDQIARNRPAMSPDAPSEETNG